MFKRLSGALFLFQITCSATEYAPWFEKPLEVHWNSTYTFQTYHSVAASKGSSNKSSNDNFLHTSFAANFLGYAAEVEALAAQTSQRPFGWDSIKATGRYQLMDDVVDDQLSLTAGVSVGKAWKVAVHDLSSFHHGRLESEFHLACGKEFSDVSLWKSRLWGVALAGVADSGSPWLRFDSSFERNYCDFLRLRFSVDTLWGLGKQGLNLKRDFHGYGSIQHQSVDLKTKVSYFLESVPGFLSLEYGYRVYAKNFPKNTSRVMLQFYYSFSPAKIPFLNVSL